MVATLIVVLPPSFTGGALVVRHEGEERTIDFSRAEFNPFHTHFAAFYADCEHEVRPLKTGHRLCLVYNLTLAKAKMDIAAPRTADHIEEVARVLRDWSAEEPAHKLAVTLEHRYTADGLVWDALKGVDRAKARVLHEAARRAECRAYLSLLTLWESGSADEDYRPRGRGRRYHEDEDEDGGYEMGEVFETALTAEHWSAADGGRPLFGPMAVGRDEVVPPDALTGVKPEEDVSGYTGNEGLTMDRWYRHAAVVVWPNARHFDVLCDCGVPAAITSLRQMVAGRQKAAKIRAADTDHCAEFAARVLARCAGAEVGDAAANELAAALFDLDEPELLRTFFREIVTNSRTIAPGATVRAACEKYGWETFRAELTGVLTATTVDNVTQVPIPRADLLERNLELLEAVCGSKSRRKAGEAARLALCGRLAGAFASSLDALDRSAAAGPDWRLRAVNRSALLVGLTRALLATGQFDLFTTTLDRVLADVNLYPLAAHVAALTELQPWLKTHLKARCAGVSRWAAVCRERLEALTVAEPTPPGDFRREANITCKCADCAELRRFLGDPAAAVHRFRAVQDRRSHLERACRGCDVDHRTERVGSPHVLVCTKNTASFRARLKKYHEDCRHLATIRTIEQALPA